ncbi:hypothetical protein [Jatrophihabitans endophyticus]|uniref:hypothetical protein n=1 Tax=Jatrophihabitans endophyticus TaxID=1206085 RepID=UPI0019F883CA|nr:hypothetical protein [Jatrophihabitans endophyticus]MBE7186835.1 hypothetical protein [Jatrophihabitans endophyticus]
MPDDLDALDQDDSHDAVFVLGGRPEDLSPEDERRRERSKRTALTLLGVVVVLVAVAITLVSVLVDTSKGPSTPSATAQQWATDLLHGDDSAREALECRGGAQSAETIRLVLTAPAEARAGRARAVGNGYRVPVHFFDPGGSSAATYTVDVVRRGGRYLVC